MLRTGVVTKAVGSANLVLHDVYGTSLPEIVSCSAQSGFALTRVAGGYQSIWHTEPVACTAIAVGDLDGDGAAEAVIGSSASFSSRVYVFTPRGYAPARASAQIPGWEGANDIAIGNVDGDAAAEIVVVNDSHAYVYDGATLALEWTAAGFGGTSVALGDVDNDGKPEIVGGGPLSSTIKIVHGDTLASSSFSLGDIERLDSIAVGDANNDGQADIVVGSVYYSVRAFNAAGTELWNLPHNERGVSGVAVGNVDEDGLNEVVFGAGWGSSAGDFLFVANGPAKTIEWKSVDRDGRFLSASADLDGDGDLELIVAARSTENMYRGGTIDILDLQGNPVAALPLPADTYVSALATGQLDSDPAVEVAVLGSSWPSGTRIHVYDGVTRLIQWSSTPTSYPQPGLSYTMIVANVDGDAVSEILAGTTDRKIQIYDGVFGVQATSAPLDGELEDLAAADLDGDGVIDLVAATNQSFYVLRASDFSQRTNVPVSIGDIRVAARPGEFSVRGGHSPATITTYAGDTLLQRRECTLFSNPLHLRYTTIGGSDYLVVGAESLLFYPASGSGCPAASTAAVGAIDFHFADYTGDGINEVVLETGNAVEIDVFGWGSAPRGDVEEDGVVADADMDALARYFYGDGFGIRPGGDVNGDSALGPDDLFYLINYRRGTGSPPP